MTPEDVWPEVTEAFAFYGKKVLPLKGPKRRRLIQALLDEGFTSEDLVAIVHGYVWRHDGLGVNADGWDPKVHFTPDSVFVMEKAEDRLERGQRGPWLSREEQVKARQKAARERVEAARAAQSGGHLKAV